MRSGLFITAALVCSVLVFVTGCGMGREEITISPAPIHELRISIAESFPPQVFLYIKGGLADSCTTLNEVRQGTISDNALTVTVTVKRPRNRACAQVYTFFEQNVNLGSSFTPGATYTVNVNDKTTSFVMP